MAYPSETLPYCTRAFRHDPFVLFELMHAGLVVCRKLKVESDVGVKADEVLERY